MSTPPDRSLTRRRLFGAAGAAAAVSVAGQGHAAAATPPPSPPLERSRAERRAAPETIPSTNPGLEYYTYPASAFVPRVLANGRDIGGLGAVITTGNIELMAPVALPVGTVVKEMTVWADNTGTATYFDLGYFAHDTNTVNYGYNFTVDIPNGQSIANPLTVNDQTTIDAGHSYFFNTVAAANTLAIKAVRLGVIPAALSYRVITPGRVYDSRPSRSGAGPLATGADRTISVADRIDPTNGVVVETDFIPAGARAVSLNITAVNTVGNGFFAVNPGGTTAVTASSINWTAGQTIANGIVCKLDASRQLTVVAGGTSTSANFIIDITGYYL